MNGPHFRKTILGAAGVLAAALLHAQAQAPLSFDVASVKPDKRFGWIRRPWNPNVECPGDMLHCGVHGNRFQEEAASLIDLMMDAYSVRRYQVAGLPGWGDTGTDVYDIDAKVEEGRTLTLAEARRMLQTLLADRFQLKVHRETRELPVYALVPAKGGPKLRKAETCEILNNRKAPVSRPADPAFLSLLSWQMIPEMLAMFTDRPVIDKTGFEGIYCAADGQYAFLDLDTRGLSNSATGRGGVPVERPGDDSLPPSIYTQVQDKWGLKLEPQKGPVDIVVIDHVERPGEN
jgi:uncharacterized protein (TIGR03435 family)